MGKASPSGVASKAGPTPHRFLSEREEPPLKFYEIGAPPPDHTAPRRGFCSPGTTPPDKPKELLRSASVG